MPVLSIISARGGEMWESVVVVLSPQYAIYLLRQSKREQRWLFSR